MENVDNSGESEPDEIVVCHPTPIPIRSAVCREFNLDRLVSRKHQQRQDAEKSNETACKGEEGNEGGGEGAERQRPSLCRSLHILHKRCEAAEPVLGFEGLNHSSSVMPCHPPADRHPPLPCSGTPPPPFQSVPCYNQC
ncbi:unnamed protein product [Heligmosomoides polygyrus]|uniref:Uncharacterized protein n=1 Tax=Heligmosomoides polygyrus TaxID=6339 RepID=A0A183FMD4_HELPZ|nr:unnamed protein product [Heligmosomoides polygyrus]